METNQVIYHAERLCRLYEYDDLKVIQYLKPFCKDNENLKELQETVELMNMMIFENRYPLLKSFYKAKNNQEKTFVEKYSELKWELFHNFGVENYNGEMIIKNRK